LHTIIKTEIEDLFSESLKFEQPHNFLPAADAPSNYQINILLLFIVTGLKNCIEF